MGEFFKARFHGETAAIVWGYHDAAVLSRWSIAPSETNPGKWTLTAAVARSEPFMLRQRPLAFTAPLQKAGFWQWPLEGDVRRIGESTIQATLIRAEF